MDIHLGRTRVIVKEGQAAPCFVGTLCRGVEGIDPLVTRQNGIQKGTYEYAVTSNADKAAIGKLLDYLASEEYSVLSPRNSVLRVIPMR